MRLVVDIEVEPSAMEAQLDDPNGYVRLLTDIATDITHAVNELGQPWKVTAVSSHARPKPIQINEVRLHAAATDRRLDGSDSTV